MKRNVISDPRQTFSNPASLFHVSGGNKIRSKEALLCHFGKYIFNEYCVIQNHIHKL
jgi:phosphoribosylaminoimidazole-succinocarboxamide synthase